MGLKIRHNGVISDLSGSDYEPGGLGTKRLKIRTGAGVKEYGLTTDPNATSYCGLNFKINGQKYCIGRRFSTSGSTQSTSQGSSTRQGNASVQANSTSQAWATRSSRYNTYSYAYTYTYVGYTTMSSISNSSAYWAISTSGTRTLTRLATRVSWKGGTVENNISVVLGTHVLSASNVYSSSFTTTRTLNTGAVAYTTSRTLPSSNTFSYVDGTVATYWGYYASGRYSNTSRYSYIGSGTYGVTTGAYSTLTSNPYYSRSEVTYTSSRSSDYTYQANYTYQSWYTYESNYTYQDTMTTTSSMSTHNFV